MDFIKNMYEEGLVEKHLDEGAWANIEASVLSVCPKTGKLLFTVT